MRMPILKEEDGSAIMGECACCGIELYLGRECALLRGEVLCCDCAEGKGAVLRLGEGETP